MNSDTLSTRAAILDGVNDMNGAYPGYGTAVADICHALDLSAQLQDLVRDGDNCKQARTDDMGRAVEAFNAIQKIAKRLDELPHAPRWQDTVPETMQIAEAARLHCRTLLELVPGLRSASN